MHCTVKYLLRTNTVLIYTIRNLTRSYGVSNLFHLTPSESYTNTNHPPTTTTTFRWPALSYMIRNIQYSFICSQQPIVEMFQSLRTVTAMLKWPCWCLAFSAATNQGSAEEGDVRFYQKYQSYLNVKPGIQTKLLQADRTDTQGIPHSQY